MGESIESEESLGESDESVVLAEREVGVVYEV